MGLLLLAIPFFYLWKFKTGLLKPAVIGTLTDDYPAVLYRHVSEISLFMEQSLD